MVAAPPRTELPARFSARAEAALPSVPVAGVATTPPAATTPAIALEEPPAEPVGALMVLHEPIAGAPGDQYASLTREDTERLAAALAVAVAAFEGGRGTTELATGLERGFDALGRELTDTMSETTETLPEARGGTMP